MWITRCNESGDFIDEFNTKEEAEKALSDYESQDEADGCYAPDFYEVVEV